MRKQTGFTLMELLIVVAIIGILGSIGYSSYQGYVLETRRSSAQNYLMHLSQAQEKFYIENRVYTANLANLGGQSSTADGMYDISVTTDNNGQGFTLSANTASGSAQAADNGCTALRLDHLNSRSPTTCW
ncbi:MAG: type IV pilin protein [Granulosicoccaceae bacterium]